MRAPLLSATAMLALGSLARADTPPTPPIKPGLWQLQTTREIDGRKAPDMGERFKNMSPEARKRMEDAMKQRGIDMSGTPGQTKACMSRESFDASTWKAMAQERCKTDFSTRGSTWKWHAVCTQPNSQTDGEANFANSEAYTVKTSSTLEMQGKTRVTAMTINAKWLGADCGDLKPFVPQQLKVPPKPGAVAKP